MLVDKSCWSSKIDESLLTKQKVHTHIDLSRDTCNLQGDTAAIQTTWMNSPGPCTLNFWYHMEGQDIGSLNVHLISTDDDPKQVYVQKVG